MKEVGIPMYLHVFKPFLIRLCYNKIYEVKNRGPSRRDMKNQDCS